MWCTLVLQTRTATRAPRWPAAAHRTATCPAANNHNTAGHVCLRVAPEQVLTAEADVAGPQALETNTNPAPAANCWLLVKRQPQPCPCRTSTAAAHTCKNFMYRGTRSPIARCAREAPLQARMTHAMPHGTAQHSTRAAGQRSGSQRVCGPLQLAANPGDCITLLQTASGAQLSGDAVHSWWWHTITKALHPNMFVTVSILD